MTTATKTKRPTKAELLTTAADTAVVIPERPAPEGIASTDSDHHVPVSAEQTASPRSSPPRTRGKRAKGDEGDDAGDSLLSASEQRTMAALRQFSDLPDEANVRLPVVLAVTGYSASTAWRRVKDGGLPKPRKLSERCTVWNVGELRRTLANA